MNLLSGPTILPKNTPSHLVIMLHGVGADGNDLIDLAPIFQTILPDAAFYSPHAPEAYDMAVFGRQWFSLRSLREEDMVAGLDHIEPILNSFIDSLLIQHSLTDDTLILMGFSQGSMTILHTALRRPKPCAALVSYSGILLAHDRLKEELHSRPPILMTHGEQDSIVPFEALEDSASTLRKLGVKVETLPLPQLAHGINEAAIQATLAFLQRHVLKEGP